MGEDLQKLSLRIPMTTEALGKIYAAGGQSNIAQEDLLEFTEIAAKMGVAFEIPAEQAGEWMAKWRAGLKLTQKEVVELSDVINYLGNNTAAGADVIGGIVTRVGSFGKIGNVGEKQIAALGAAIAGAGKSEEVAATGIKNLLVALTSGKAATEQQIKAFQHPAIEIDPKIMAQNMMKDPEQVIMELLERISNVPQAEQAAVIKQMFGKESLDAISPLLSNLDEVKRIFALTKGEYAGSMEKEFAAMADTATNSFQLAQNAAAAFSKQIGDALLPNVKSAAKWLVDISSAVLSFSQANPGVFNTIVKGIAAFGAIRVASNVFSLLGTLISFPFTSIYAKFMNIRAAWIAADGSLLKLIKNTKIGEAVTKAYAAAQWLLGKALKAAQILFSVGKLIAYKAAQIGVAIASKTWTAAQWLLNAALSANPIGLVVIAIAALVGAFVWAYNKCEWFREKWDNLMAVLANNPIGTLISAIQEKFTAGFEKITALIEKVGNAWDKFKAALGIAPKIPVPDGQPIRMGRGGDGIIAAAHAAGGIFNRPHLGIVAEAGRESIIPHNPGGERIWQTTGEMAGFTQPSNPGGGSVFSPTFNITIQASPGEDGNAIARQFVQAVEPEFGRLFERYMAQKGRLAYS
jgi:TP901 family phage tail tape measure protein